METSQLESPHGIEVGNDVLRIDLPLAALVGEGGWIVEAFVQQADVERLSPNGEATFYPVHRPDHAIKGTVVEIARTRTTQLPHAMLATPHGGPIAMPEDAEYVLSRTCGVHGFYGASSMERLPTEVALTETARRFVNITR